MRRQRREKSLNIPISALVFLHRNYNFHVNRITGAEVKMYKVHKATFFCRTQGAVQESSDFQTL